MARPRYSGTDVAAFANRGMLRAALKTVSVHVIWTNIQSELETDLATPTAGDAHASGPVLRLTWLAMSVALPVLVAYVGDPHAPQHKRPRTRAHHENRVFGTAWFQAATGSSRHLRERRVERVS